MEPDPCLPNPSNLWLEKIKSPLQSPVALPPSLTARLQPCQVTSNRTRLTQGAVKIQALASDKAGFKFQVPLPPSDPVTLDKPLSLSEPQLLHLQSVDIEHEEQGGGRGLGGHLPILPP